MTLEETKAAIDARLEELSEYILLKQSECMAAYGVYFQALPTHSSLPENGEVMAADNLSAKPSDQPFGWNDVGGYPLTEPLACTRIDTYHGSSGYGFVVTLEFKYSDNVWSKAINFGPESHRSYDWVSSQI